jgi:hypothetical protein
VARTVRAVRYFGARSIWNRRWRRNTAAAAAATYTATDNYYRRAINYVGTARRADAEGWIAIALGDVKTGYNEHSTMPRGSRIGWIRNEA